MGCLSRGAGRMTAHKHQRWTHRRAGKPVGGRDASILAAHDELQDWVSPLRHAGFDVVSSNWGSHVRQLGCPSFPFIYAGHSSTQRRRLARVPLLHTKWLAATLIQFRTQPRWQAFADVLHTTHFLNRSSTVWKLSERGKGRVPDFKGSLPNFRGELPHVA